MAAVPPRVSITIPDGLIRELIEAVRTRDTAEHALALELWGYDPADAPASRVVMDIVFMGTRQFQVELEAESYQLEAQREDPERREWVAYSMAQMVSKVRQDAYGDPGSP
jgi:hypothetical protein